MRDRHMGLNQLAYLLCLDSRFNSRAPHLTATPVEQCSFYISVAIGSTPTSIAKDLEPPSVYATENSGRSGLLIQSCSPNCGVRTDEKQLESSLQILFPL